MANKAPSAAIYEKNIGQYATRLTYAAVKDFTNDSDKNPMYNKYLCQTYDSYIAPVDKNAEKSSVREIVRYSSEVKQAIKHLFGTLLSEVSACDLAPTDTAETIVAKVTVTAAPPVLAKFMYDYNAAKSMLYGPTLRGEGDNTSWFLGQITGTFAKYIGSPPLIAQISTIFDGFMKATAYSMAAHLMYKEKPLNIDLFRSVLLENGANQLIIDLMSESIRAPKPKPPKKNTTADATEAVGEATADATDAAATADTTADAATNADVASDNVSLTLDDMAAIITGI